MNHPGGMEVNKLGHDCVGIDCGFEDAEFFPSLTGTKDESQDDLIAIVARKQG